VAAGAWIGIDVVLATLVVTAWATGDVDTEAVCYQALELFAVWPLSIAGAVSLVTGVVLGLGSRYGLVRYWWVATKLVMNVMLTTLVLLVLRPGVEEVAEYGRRLAARRPGGADVGFLFYPPVVSLTALLVAVMLSVFKPWGRIRRLRQGT
jgi:phage shock protein PspC (stress-responsive transcriptional regulator)